MYAVRCLLRYWHHRRSGFIFTVTRRSRRTGARKQKRAMLGHGSRAKNKNHALGSCRRMVAAIPRKSASATDPTVRRPTSPFCPRQRRWPLARSPEINGSRAETSGPYSRTYTRGKRIVVKKRTMIYNLSAKLANVNQKDEHLSLIDIKCSYLCYIAGRDPR